MIARLGDVATYVNGYAFKPSDWSDIGLPIIRIQDLTGNSYQANRYNGEYDKRYEIHDGDVLISWSASLGVYVWTGEKAVLNQHIFKVVFNKLEVDKSFFVHQVRNILENSVSQAHGATMKHLTKPVFDALPFNLPSVAEQQRISSVLDKLTSMISLRKQQLARLDEVVKARFVEMFGDYRINNKGFERFKGSELFKFSSGKFLSEEKRQDRGIPVYGGNGIAWYTDLALIEYPTIIIGRVGAQCGNIHLVEGPVWVTDNAIYIKEQKIDGLRLEFLSELMTMMDFYQYADFSGQPKITQKPLENMLYIVPPVEMQEQFSVFVGRIDQQKLTIQQSLDKMEVLKRLLMQEYFGNR